MSIASLAELSAEAETRLGINVRKESDDLFSRCCAALRARANYRLSDSSDARRTIYDRVSARHKECIDCDRRDIWIRALQFVNRK